MSSHDFACERNTYEGGICTCQVSGYPLDDRYDDEPSNMADMEDGIYGDFSSW